jgi:uncharacterized protein (DUF58 family)
VIVRPSKKLLVTILVFGVAAIALAILKIIATDLSNSLYVDELFLLTSLSLLVICMLDFFQQKGIGALNAERVLPSSFALHRQQHVLVSVENRLEREMEIKLSDGIPSNFKVSDFPLHQIVKVGESALFNYNVIPARRGAAEFEPAFIQISSKHGFWEFCLRLGKIETARVYPDFSAIINSAMLGVEKNLRFIGAHVAKKKGGGLEFNQLREFRSGDTLKQIDWKTTARLESPISKEFQEERDQNIIFLLDCSRRMRAVENELSYFDYALNALLTSSYIALDKGDAVGVMTFSGHQSWLSPVKGKSSVNRILNHLYDLETSTQSSDYIHAAESLIKQHNKRSLIVMMTNLRAEDQQDLYDAVKLLSKKHLVMVVTLKESLLETIDADPVDNLSQANTYAGVKLFADQRDKMLTKMRAHGIAIVDATHKDLHVKLVSEYLRLKQSGRL